MHFQKISVIIRPMAAEDAKNDGTQVLPSIDDLLKSSESGSALPVATDGVAGDGGDGADVDPEDIDKILAQEDPDFATRLKEIQDSEFSTTVAIEAVDIEAFLTEGEKIKEKKAALKKLKFKDRFLLSSDQIHAGISKAIDDAQNFAIKLVKAGGKLLVLLIKNIFKYGMSGSRKFFSWLSHLPKRVVLLSISVLLLASASGFIFYLSFKGHFLPHLNREYLTGFAEHVDATFEYKEEDSKESFDSEIRHPEHMYEMERVIVNLRQNADGDHTPMGLFEFYIATNSQDAIVEIGDRRTEARHIIERVIEQMSYAELVSAQGKAKLKFIVRKELNDFLTKSHHVRQVYIKTFVLKP